MSDNLLGNQKTKVIETGKLSIKGHLLKWDDVIIQINNISMITTSNMQTPPFPILTALVALFGLFLLSKDGLRLIGCVLMVVAAIILYIWYNKVQTLKNRKYLNIMLNSGLTYSVIFYQGSFLDEVLQVFSNIFEEGAKANVNYNIDLRECHIEGNGSVVRNIR